MKKVFPDAISRYTEIFSNGMELDIYIPSIKLGIEYDGMAWHKTDKIPREKKKYSICQENGIRLLRLMEKPPEGGNLATADESLTIMDGPMYDKKHLVKAIRLLLDKIDPERSSISLVRYLPRVIQTPSIWKQPMMTPLKFCTVWMFQYVVIFTTILLEIERKRT